MSTFAIRSCIAASVLLALAAIAMQKPQALAQDARPVYRPTPAVPAKGQVHPGVITVQYNAADLAVWRPRGEAGLHYDPSVLIACIKMSVAADSWKTIGRITTSDENGIILVTHTGENHEKTSELFRSLRDEKDRFEEVEFNRRRKLAR